MLHPTSTRPSSCQNASSSLLRASPDSRLGGKFASGGKTPLSGRAEVVTTGNFISQFAALCVFIAVYAWFYHANERKLVPWEEGLIQAAGIEQRPYDEVFGQTDASDEPRRSNVDVLILRVDNRITGTSETLFMDDDGSRTVLLQGWTSGGSGYFIRDYNEMILYPVPDRVMYVDGAQQHLLWGKPLDGGVEILPRLVGGDVVNSGARDGQSGFILSPDKITHASS